MKKVVLLSVVLTFNLYANEVKNLNDMTVTAQKTEESIQDVPLSMSVFNDVDLEDKEIESIKDLSFYVPNFYILDPGDYGAYAPSIRGLSSTTELLSAGISIYIDGIPTTVPTAFDVALEDIERIEVLRGPQSTLYGKGSEVGVINIVTKQPDNDLRGKVSLAYGEDNKQEAILSVKTPIIKDKLYIGVSGRYRSKDGFLKNSLTGDYDNNRKDYYSKIHLRATPTDRLEMSLIASKFKRDSGTVSNNSVNAENHREYSSDLDGNLKSSDENYVFDFKYDFDVFNIESVTSYSKNIHKRYNDLDYSEARIFHMKANMPTKTFSEELRLNGQLNNLQYLFGLFGSVLKRTGGFQVFSDIPQNAFTMDSVAKDTSLGVFMHLKYALNDNLFLIGGLRYDKDKNEYDYDMANFHDSQTSNNISPKIALEYKINPNIMTYVSATKGYKAGGYYIMAADGYDKNYDSETLWNYEAGVKSLFFDNRLMLNANVYYMDIKDMQVLSAVDAYSAYMSNAASASSKGIEIEANYLVNDNFSIFTNFGYNETKFDDYKDFGGNYKGKYNPFTPNYNYAIGGTFRGFNGVYASADISGYGKMYLDNSNTYKKSPYAVVNAKIGYEWENFDIYLYANNLFDKEYDLVGYFGQYILLSQPREVGLRLTYRF